MHADVLGSSTKGFKENVSLQHNTVIEKRNCHFGH